MRKMILFIFCLFALHLLFAQKKIVLEQVRWYNSNQPLNSFIQDPEIAKTIASQLKEVLLQKQQVELVDTDRINNQFIGFYYKVPPIEPKFNADPSLLHLYIDILEADPFYYFRNLKNKPADTSLPRRTKTMFTFSAWILKPDKKILYQEDLEVLIAEGETAGMGLPYGKGISLHNLTVLPKAFTDFLKISFDHLFDSTNEMSQLEMKLRPAFLADDYILPKTIGKARTLVSTNKNISVYTQANKKEMIRMDEPVYEEIRLTGKNLPVYPSGLIKAIRRTPHYSGSDFVYLRQVGRDVVRDKNYLLKLVVQIDPQNAPPEESMIFTNFLEGSFHCLLNDDDTVAIFTINKNVSSKNTIYTNTIFNGIDSSYFYKIKTASRIPSVELGYDYVVEGQINKNPFTIKCSGMRNSVKEIFLGDKLVCIAQGKFTPEKFVVFDASLSSGLLNQLFLIGFNRFFE